MSSALAVRAVCRQYGKTAALTGASLAAHAGEYVTLLGPSGSGKTTLLRVIAGFEQPNAGQVLLDGEDVTFRPAHMRGVGVVFQSFALFPHLNVFDNIAFGLRYRQQGRQADEAQVRQRVQDGLALVALTGFDKRAVSDISGGQRQRVALARCLVGNPKIVLLDEPLGALDANLRQQMTTELVRIQKHIGATFLHVTGNEQEALAMGARVAVLDGGRIAQFDTPRSLFENPATPRVASLLNAYNPVRADQLRGLAAGDGTLWLIRNDRVHASQQVHIDSGRVGLSARYLASEYAGSRVLALFDVGEHRPFEVQYHLGHGRPPEFETGQAYTLSWAIQDGLRHPQAA